MKFDDMIANTKDAVTVKKVFGESHEQDGITIIPAARVMGGGGGGTGQDDDGQLGEGGGIGMIGRPAGAFVIQNGTVTWRPAVDPNTVIVALVVVTVAVLVTRAWDAGARDSQQVTPATLASARAAVIRHQQQPPKGTHQPSAPSDRSREAAEGDGALIRVGEAQRAAERRRGRMRYASNLTRHDRPEIWPLCYGSG